MAAGCGTTRRARPRRAPSPTLPTRRASRTAAAAAEAAARGAAGAALGPATVGATTAGGTTAVVTMIATAAAETVTGAGMIAADESVNPVALVVSALVSQSRGSSSNRSGGDCGSSPERSGRGSAAGKPLMGLERRYNALLRPSPQPVTPKISLLAERHNCPSLLAGVFARRRPNFAAASAAGSGGPRRH